MEIVKIDINKIKPYENNVKNHPKEQIKQIMESIQEFGNNDPIAIDENYVIIEGHGRYEALKKLKYEEVECIILNGLTEEQKNAYRLVHNKLTMNSDFDLSGLEKELKKIVSIDMEKYDFDLTDIVNEQPKEIIEDEPPEAPVKPKSKYGEIYQLGNHRLMCGDSTKEEDVAKLMEGNIADLVVTDPPYNVDYGSKAEAINKYGYKFSDRHIKNDYMPEFQFIDFLNNAFANMSKFLKEGGSFYIWHASTTVYEFEEALRLNNLKTRQQLIWVKNALVLGRQDYQWKHEPCLYGWKEGSAHYFIDDRTLTTVFEDELDFDKMKKEDMKKLLEEIFADKVKTTIIHEDKPFKSIEHPTMKPIKLLANLINNSSKEKENVLDLFGGSGSTLIACEQLNRNCYMIELDPKYVDVIIERWEKFTGQKAIKIN